MAENREAWPQLLDELERQLARSRPEYGLGSEPSGIWGIENIRASVGPLGTIPFALVARVTRILGEYEEAFVRINAAKRIVGDHLDMLQSVRGNDVALPVYFDRVG